MKLVSTIFVGALLCLAPTASWADLAPYSQDFEGLTPAPQPQDPFESSLADDGWLIFANVFGPGFYYNYGPFVAPNTGFGFSAVETGQGDPPQGIQQLSVFSDYNNGNHYDGSGAVIESNVFREQLITAADVGSTWRFEFDARRANIADNSTAAAFFKTIVLDPCCSLDTYIPVDMTNVPDTWGHYSLSIYIDPSLEGQILQFGFLNNASNGEDSGVFYDNVNFDLAPLSVGIDVKPGSDPNSINPYNHGVVPVALLGSETFSVLDVDVTTLALGALNRAPYHDLTNTWVFSGHLEDVNMDGFADLVSHYRTRYIGIMCGDTEVTLSGELLDGTRFEGTDEIRTVGCPPPERAKPLSTPETMTETSATESSVFGK